MDRVMNWCYENEHILNLKYGKTETMLFGTSKNISTQTKVTLGNNNSVNHNTSYKYLGIKINPSLNLNSNFDYIYRKSSSRLGLLYNIRPLVDVKPTAKIIYQSMVLPLLTYCPTLQ